MNLSFFEVVYKKCVNPVRNNEHAFVLDFPSFWHEAVLLTEVCKFEKRWLSLDSYSVNFVPSFSLLALFCAELFCFPIILFVPSYAMLFTAKLFLVVRCFLLYDASYLIMMLSSFLPDMVEPRESWVADFYLLIRFAIVFQIYFSDTLSISLPEMCDAWGWVVDDFLCSHALWGFQCYFLRYQAVFFNRSVWIRRTLTFGRLKCCKLRSVMFYFCHFARWFFVFLVSFF